MFGMWEGICVWWRPSSEDALGRSHEGAAAVLSGAKPQKGSGGWNRISSENVKKLNDALADIERFYEELQEGKAISENLYLDLNIRLYAAWDIWRKIISEAGG